MSTSMKILGFGTLLQNCLARHSPKFVLGFWMCVFSLVLSSQARSYTIVVDGSTYNITLFEGQSFDANVAILQTAPFWGSSIVATSFASAFTTQIGVPDTTTTVDAVYFAFQESTFNFEGQSIPVVNTMFATEESMTFDSSTLATSSSSSEISFASATVVPDAARVPEINAGGMSQAGLLLFVLWLVVTGRARLRPIVMPSDI